MDTRTVGVEEEFILIDPTSGRPRAAADAVLRLGRRGGDVLLQSELQSEQLETGTRPCSSMTELADQIRAQRHLAAAAARRQGVAIAALGTSPLPVRPTITPEERYVRMAGEYALTAAEHLICGCHVHVAVESAEEGVAVLDRIRPWLPPLLALSANSPFWQGTDSGYASYRRQVMGRWPSSGPTELFGTAASYRAAVQEMLDTGAIIDAGMVYFDARLSRRYPTVEIRIADVCLLMDDALLVAALVGALVETAARAWRAGEPASPVRASQLRLATWRAARSGLRHDLVHPLTGRPAPAETVVRALVEHTAPVLAETGDLITVEGLLLGVFKRGNGAEQQWEVHQRTGDLSEVVAYAVARTLES
ncbi:carboxylate-amine ligase [Actinoallomurus rhizosphaericola]|uniref:carboxylate-amine ligase n=1 Tax=Actinoallomurus rhizosphaericola TaxID=2952536 RepID=UPI0020925AB6|nr:glutamate--cysteine ligase [Actinoallomurus rhizosphaericola]MCO5995974.1 glutamate--cysteine ligase [Actinoallomurus rhizosphaericola]